MEQLRSIAEICEQVKPVNDIGLRPWAIDDAPSLVAAWTDAQIGKWNPVPPEPTLELAESWIAGTATQNVASVGIDVVVDRDGEVLGEIGLQVDVEQVIAEVGFWLSAPARGMGVGVTLLQHCETLAAQLELRGLIALVHADNAAALATLASVGWVEVPTTSKRRAFAFRA